jgi:hypothetical protein
VVTRPGKLRADPPQPLRQRIDPLARWKRKNGLNGRASRVKLAAAEPRGGTSGRSASLTDEEVPTYRSVLKR